MFFFSKLPAIKGGMNLRLALGLTTEVSGTEVLRDFLHWCT